MVPIDTIDDLGKKGNSKGNSIIFLKSPFKTGTAMVTDIKEAEGKENIEVIIAFNNGKIWKFDPNNVSNS